MKPITTITFLLLVAFNNLKAQDSIICSNINLSFVNLKTSYLTTDSAITLTGLPSGGQFYGCGIMKNKFYPKSLKAGLYSIVYVLQDSIGCSTAICETVTIAKTTGIDTTSNGIYLALYPNPSNGIFNLNINSSTVQTYNILVVNLVGQIILTKKYSNINGNNIQQIDLSNNEAGMYILQISVNEGIIKTYKIIKKQ